MIAVRRKREIKTIYNIKRGDTLAKIAETYGVTIDKLKIDNEIIDEKRLKIGDYLIIGKR